MTTGYTIEEFLDEATKKYVELNNILIKAYSIGYRYTEEIEFRIIMSNIYLWVLKRIGNSYALSSNEISDIVKHLIILLELYDIQPLDTDDFLTTPVKDNTLLIAYIPMSTNNSVSFNYDTILRPITNNVSYTTDSNGNTVVTINHKLDKTYPQFNIVETSGSVVVSHVRFIDSNRVEFTFTSDSKGIITLM